MSKLLDMFTQVRRAQSGSGMGFLGKNRPELKPRAAALVVELTDVGSAEAAIKAGVDGLLFAWDGKDTDWLETLKTAVDAAKASNETVVWGLHITGGWDKLELENLEQLKDQGVHYIVLPIQAPARLLALKTKDIDLVVTVPMSEGELYPIFIRNLTAFENIAAVQLDFDLPADLGKLTIEGILQYRAVREAVRFPALINVKSNMDEADAFTLTTLGVQAVVLAASDSDDKMKKQVKALRELLEKVYQEEKDKTSPINIKP